MSGASPKTLAPWCGDLGLGDATHLLAFLLYANLETQTYLGDDAYLSLPSSSYDKNRYFNVGEYVYRTVYQQ